MPRPENGVMQTLYSYRTTNTLFFAWRASRSGTGVSRGVKMIHHTNQDGLLHSKLIVV